MRSVLISVNDFVWGAPALVLILSVGLYLSLRTGFVQLRLLWPSVKRLFSRDSRKQDASGVTPFRALCTALAATVGTGNMAGVAGAIAIGGPGAIFWMWVCGVLGMAVKFAEATLAVRYREKDESGAYVGGPMYMIRCGMGSKWGFLASLYSFFGVFAALGVGNATQVNALMDALDGALQALSVPDFPLRRVLLGGALGLLVFTLIRGGARRIGAAAEKLVPVASLGYIALCAGVLIGNSAAIGPAFQSIFLGAFSPRAATGGALGSAMCALRTGVSRGVFTNEAGMGTAAMAHAGAEVAHPVHQGMLGILEVFLDTIVICTMTALAILCSGIPIPYGVDEGFVLTRSAFESVYGSWVSVPLALFLACFALATILGWGLYGMRCAQYLLGRAGSRGFAAAQGITVLLSVLLNTGTVWLLSEIVNGLMAIPNLLALAALSGELLRLLKEYNSIPGGLAANGGTYENFHQRKPLRALSHAQVPPLRRGSRAPGQDHLPSEHRSA